MEIEFRSQSAIKARCLAHKGPYYLIGQTFGQLGSYFEAGEGPGIAFYYDDPSTVAPEALRSYAGFIVREETAANASNLELVEVPEGTFAVTVHQGPYDGLSNAWMVFFDDLFQRENYSVAGMPTFEIYVNDMSKAAPEELLTELWVRVQPK